MTDFDYKDISIAEQIKDFYEILECADRDYRNEIDKEYMYIILTEISDLNLTEEHSYDLEFLSQRNELYPDNYVYTAEDLEIIYEILSSFRYDLFKKHNISSPLLMTFYV